MVTIGAIAGRVSGRQLWILVVKQGSDHFKPVADLCTGGDVRIHIDRAVGLDYVPEALAHVGEGHALGKVVINVE